MHLQQTKSGSRATGGPQYYFHDVPATIKDFLRRRGACPVILETPYGIANTPFKAVGKDHRIASDGRVIAGKVGHDRIQQGEGEGSIGEAIRRWYVIKDGSDFERIDVEVRIHPQGHFILAPTSVKLRGKTRLIRLVRPERPLSFHRHLQGRLWCEQIELVRRHHVEDLSWAAMQIMSVVADHRVKSSNISESDVLRSSGALSKLGLKLGPYLLAGYDCQNSVFQFQRYPEYSCPVEIKKRSRSFSYQIENYRTLPRAVVLCVTHDLDNPPDDIDVIDLSVLGEYLKASRG